MGEGQYYWEKFGHNALWFYDPVQGIDVAYNWGMFDFSAPGYLRRLLIGDPKYWVEGIPSQLLIDSYRQYDRTVWVQRLNLTPAQAQRAYAFVLWNAREENKYYRYDYFLDNCSTRVRDVIDLALGGIPKIALTHVGTPRTYRSETVRLVDDMRLTQFDIDLALGKPADRPLTLWENAFVPSRLRDAVRDLRVPGPNGAPVSLVAEERIVYQGQSHEERADDPNLVIPYLVVGLLLAAELLVVGWAGERSSITDKIFRIEVAVWAFLTGVLGAVLLLAWLITQHVFWYRNENLLLVNPLSLWLAVLVPLSIWRPRFLRPATILAFVIGGLAALALLVKPIPGFAQDNIPIILLLVPPHAAIAFSFWRRTRSASPA